MKAIGKVQQNYKKQRNVSIKTGSIFNKLTTSSQQMKEITVCLIYRMIQLNLQRGKALNEIWITN